MNHRDLQAFLRETFDKCLAISAAKSSDYSGINDDALSNFTESARMLGISPVRGILLRDLDKVRRIISFDERGKLEVPNESVDDACMDRIIYCALLRALVHERLNLPMKRIEAEPCKHPSTDWPRDHVHPGVCECEQSNPYLDTISGLLLCGSCRCKVSPAERKTLEDVRTLRPTQQSVDSAGHLQKRPAEEKPLMVQKREYEARQHERNKPAEPKWCECDSPISNGRNFKTGNWMCGKCSRQIRPCPYGYLQKLSVTEEQFNDAWSAIEASGEPSTEDRYLQHLRTIMCNQTDRIEALEQRIREVESLVIPNSKPATEKK